MSFLNQEWIKESPCPSNEKCDSPSGTGHVSGSYTYTCVWPPCKKNEDCVDNYCCDKDPAIPTADQGSGTCNWGPGSSSRVYKNKYLCDPPEWNSKEAKTQNILELIISTFFSLFLPEINRYSYSTLKIFNTITIF